MNDELADLRRLALPFDIDDVDPQCIKCVRFQMDKYRNYIDPQTGDKGGGKFFVPCTGIPKHSIDPSLKAAFDPEVWDELEAMVDVSKWAKRYIKNPADSKMWEARWYQEEVLRCTSRRKVLRIARRCGKTDAVCIDILFNLYTNEGIKIVVAAPQKSQAEEIITRVRAFIGGSSELQKMVTRDVSAPYYEIKLSNGSRLRGFSIGTKDNVDAVGIRGQDADRIYIEEMDYASDTAIQGSVFPILQTNPNTSLIGFSTPSGFKTPYYYLCKENPYYREFFYNYKVLPWWKNVESERANFTEDMWSREFLAEFGETESGVYKPSYIDRCLRNYQYKENRRVDSWRYTIGTDWNEKKGAEIVVLGHNQFTGKFQVVETVGVGKSEFTQLAGISKLLELNKKWKPSFIYIDAGNGSTNYELLMKTAQKARGSAEDRDTARLLTVLKKYDSGASIETKDPITGQAKKSQAKAFMVNASIRMFEQDRIVLSSDDKILENQLRNYIVDRISPTGVPVYKAQDEKTGDHRLDALNLAIVAFHLEFDDLYKQSCIMTMLAAPDPRTGNKQVSNRKYETEKTNQPDERRLENIDTLQYARMSGRTDNIRGNTNRPGWDTDEEDKRYQEFLQRRRSNQSRLNKNRPQRNSF